MNGAVPETPHASRIDLWVVGNVLIDLMMKGVPEIPRWGEEVLATGRSEQIGGQGANLARAAVRLGLSTELAAVVGDDAPGDRIRATLEAEGDRCSRAQDSDGAYGLRGRGGSAGRRARLHH